MADKYRNFEELQSNETEWRIDFNSTEDPGVGVIAIHAGSIEAGTSELCLELAQENNLSFYMFEGLKSSGNVDLHITSTNFDEPNCLDLVSKLDRTISLHGCKGETEFTLVGGSDGEASRLLTDILVKYGFEATLLSPDHKLSGSNPNNIANKCISGKSVQLELSTEMRRAMYDKFSLKGRATSQNDTFYKYVTAINEFLGLWT
ncbi:poly-gamma-glutamate hydrolase [Listeria phage LIS04]|nr:poly-gamma-glutamate hydrolase [Listeria phage LIS04]